MALNLKIITPDGIFYDGNVQAVNVKTSEGYIGLLEWHTPIIANIAISTMMIRTNNQQTRNFSIAGGLLVTNLHEIRIISDKIQQINQSATNLDQENN